MRKVQPIRDERVIDGLKEYFYIRSMRNYLFFCMGIYSGLRVWQTKGTHISVVEQKNKHAKTFIIHPNIRSDLDEYTADMFPNDRFRLKDIGVHSLRMTWAYRLLYG